MPTLRFGKVWQVIRHFGVLFFAILVPLKQLFQISSPLGKYCTPYSKYDHPNNVPVGQKNSRMKKSLPQKCINFFLAHKLSHDR
jgi:hypothetical protein